MLGCGGWLNMEIVGWMSWWLTEFIVCVKELVVMFGQL